MASTSSQQPPLRVDGTALKKVHDTLKKDVGAVRILFSTGPKPNTHYLKDLTEDASQQYGFSAEEKAAALFLFSQARVKGTETAEYTAFLTVLRQPCPKPPSDGDGAFLPYLSFLCAPDRKKYIRDERLIDGKQYDPNDDGRIVPPHPRGVAPPAPPQRNAYTELSVALSRAASGGAVGFTTFAAVMKDVDRGVPTAESRRLFNEALVAHTGSPKAAKAADANDSAVVPIGVLLEVCKPQLTMERQKTRSSSLVKGAFTWDVPSPPTPTRNGGGGGTPRRGSNSPRNAALMGASAGGASSRSASSSSARKGFHQTRSASLRQQLAQEQLNDPTSPYYNKGVYKHIPAVPDAHYRKQSQLGLTSRYSPRSSPRRPSAAAAEAAEGAAAPQ